MEGTLKSTLVIFNRSAQHTVRVRFAIASMISDQNCMTRSSITTLLQSFWNCQIQSVPINCNSYRISSSIRRISGKSQYPENQRPSNTEEKSLRQVAMVVKLLDDNKMKISLKKWICTVSNFINYVVFTCSIKWVHEIRKFHVVVMQWQLRNVQNSVICTCKVLFAFLPFLLLSPS